MNITSHRAGVTPRSARRRGAVLSGIAIAALALAGCATTETTTDESASAMSFGQEPAGDTSGGGVSGLLASLEDGLLQVQSTDEQTAVRYTEGTTMTRDAEISASDIEIGSCVVVAVSTDDSAATTIAVSEPEEDGTCAVAAMGAPGGGFGQAPGDEGGMPSEGEDGEAQAQAPAEGEEVGERGGMPSGMGQSTSGTVVSMTDTTLTISTEEADGGTESTEVALGDDTTITTTVDATADDLAVGQCVTASGEADDRGGFDATALDISNADEAGQCASNTMGGAPTGERPDASTDSEEENSNG